jgi:hypothetical protein
VHSVRERFAAPSIGCIEHGHCHIADYRSAEKTQKYNEQNLQIHDLTPPFHFLDVARGIWTPQNLKRMK